jgi:hypothetical protein
MIEPSFTRSELNLTIAALKEKLDRSTDLNESTDMENLIDYLEQVT